jgi:ADP-heptose:LPS heptosyltransferase
MLSMDSGNGHLAAMYRIPVITLWGVTHPFAGFVPFGQSIENCLTTDKEKFPLVPTSIYGNKFPEGYEDSMKSISPQKIIDKLVITLQNKS